MDDKQKAKIDGREAARERKPHTVNPYKETDDLYLIWFNAWHIAKVEIEEHTKLSEDDDF